MIHQYMHEKVAESWNPVIAEKADVLVQALKDDPVRFKSHVSQYVFWVLFSLCVCFPASC